MTDAELRRLSRRELLEMLISETEENMRLRAELEQARAKLQDRRILLEKSGSMAEAALRLNGVFEAADKAARQYLENAHRMAQEKESE
ncbi:MAG: DNA repair protein [Candidatus Faecousia sp.]|nr:DNA repair protein [Clostridiales bacterium]MCI6937760.1 DNA repair protein [Clostridiales bacterium]MDD5883613.1 DNA repair protein [Bacillota bacterium]MDY4598860.1 DNA repair protein [Candidatus Faecousia sp.]